MWAGFGTKMIHIDITSNLLWVPPGICPAFFFWFLLCSHFSRMHLYFLLCTSSFLSSYLGLHCSRQCCSSSPFWLLNACSNSMSLLMALNLSSWASLVFLNLHAGFDSLSCAKVYSSPRCPSWYVCLINCTMSPLGIRAWSLWVVARSLVLPSTWIILFESMYIFSCLSFLLVTSRFLWQSLRWFHFLPPQSFKLRCLSSLFSGFLFTCLIFNNMATTPWPFFSMMNNDGFSSLSLHLAWSLEVLSLSLQFQGKHVSSPLNYHHISYQMGLANRSCNPSRI